jgi:hypothetical protein
MRKRSTIAAAVIFLLLIISGWFGYGAWLDREERARLAVPVAAASQIVDRVIAELSKHRRDTRAINVLRDDIVPLLQKLNSDLEVTAARPSRVIEEQKAALLYCKSAAALAQNAVLYAKAGVTAREVMDEWHRRYKTEEARGEISIETRVSSGRVSNAMAEERRYESDTKDALASFWGAWARVKELGYPENVLANRLDLAMFASLPLMMKPEALGMTKESFEALVNAGYQALDAREKATKK